MAPWRHCQIDSKHIKAAIRPDFSDLFEPGSPLRDRWLAYGAGDSVQAPDGRPSRVLIRDTWNTEVVDELKPEPGDIEIYKHGYSAFHVTELNTVLKGLGVKYLIVTGCTTSVCVESTIRDAHSRDYYCILLEDCAAEPIGQSAAGYIGVQGAERGEDRTTKPVCSSEPLPLNRPPSQRRHAKSMRWAYCNEDGLLAPRRVRGRGLPGLLMSGRPEFSKTMVAGLRHSRRMETDMNHSWTLISSNAARSQSRSRDWTHWYYSGGASVMIAAGLVGFQQLFLQGRAYPGQELTPQIRTMIIVHGVCMTGWVLGFLVQTILIATGRNRTHMLLGRIPAVLAAFILLSGFWFVWASFRLKPPQFILFALTTKEFMLVSFTLS